jgi:hypothetical protein
VPGSTRHCSPTSRVPAYRQTAAGRGADFGRLLRRVSVTPAAHALAAPIRSDWRSRTFADHAGPSMSTRRSTKVRPRFSDLAAVALDAGRRPRTQAWIATTSRARHVGANTPGSDVEELPVRVTKGLRGRAPVGEVPPASGGGSDLGANGGGGESQDCGRTMTATRAGRHPNRPVRIGERPPEARTAPTWLRHLGEGVPVTDGRRAVLSRLVDPPVAPVDPPVAACRSACRACRSACRARRGRQPVGRSTADFGGHRHEVDVRPASNASPREHYGRPVATTSTTSRPP